MLDLSGGRSKRNVQNQAQEQENWTFQQEEARKMSKNQTRNRKTGPVSRKKQEKCPESSPGAGKLNMRWICRAEEAREMSKSKLRSVKTGPASRKKQEKCPKTSPGTVKLDISVGRSKKNVQKQAPEQGNWTCRPVETRIMSKTKSRNRKTEHALDLPAGISK